jgi:hypothetical protein
MADQRGLELGPGVAAFTLLIAARLASMGPRATNKAIAATLHAR